MIIIYIENKFEISEIIKIFYQFEILPLSSKIYFEMPLLDYHKKM